MHFEKKLPIPDMNSGKKQKGVLNGGEQL